MGTLKLIKEDGRCEIRIEHETIHDIMKDFALLTGGLIASTDVSRETWLDWIRSEEFEDVIIDMADAECRVMKERRAMKGGDRHKKKSTCDRRRRSDVRRKV